ncbi:putative hemolysin [Saccharopolyspora lacisalsi]|uniref:Putative hemolysin n=1 Tax=Halosaccharopolyspora lacisalsi TaxID=1000566 RepID=A0A839E684_9PSEU|nr:hemolysin family protein [Halosaccharopolyspora lacisalsi]MBA8827227.1 putative hemolysin [Halosaccharopolyspora lacisalsi]
MDSVALNLLLIVVFVLLGGFFAAAEIALVSLREGQVRRLAERGRRGARVASLKRDSNRFLSAVQIGVTFTGFFASSYGGATIAARIQPALADWGLGAGLAATVSLLVVTLFVSYLSLVLGELTPKRLALQRTEGVALATAGVLDKVATVCRPAIWLLSKSTNAVVRLVGLNPAAAEQSVSEQELRDMVRTSEQLTDEERRLVSDAFEASDRVLSEVMVPRTEVHFLSSTLSLAEATTEIAGRPHSRYPVIGETVDDVVGFVHVRDLFSATLREDGAAQTLGRLARPVTALPGSKPILAALTRMRGGGGHLAVVVDEYGGTDGIVTVEDLVEEVVGEIQDEYDPKLRPVRSVAEGTFEVDGLLHRNEVEEQTGIVLPEGSYDTLAGFALSRFERMPAEGDSVDALGHRFRVLSMDGRRIARLRVTRLDGTSEGSSG